MTIEQEMCKVLKENMADRVFKPVEEWQWTGEPNPFHIPCVDKVMIKIDFLIAHADDTECLTSSSEYIRECKKWFNVSETSRSNSYIQKLLTRFGTCASLQDIMNEAIVYALSTTIRNRLLDKFVGEIL